jgi:hypothetical protein
VFGKTHELEMADNEIIVLTIKMADDGHRPQVKFGLNMPFNMQA